MKNSLTLNHGDKMLKHLIEIIKDLDLKNGEFDNYQVMSTHFGRFDERESKFVRIEMPKSEDDFDESKKYDTPIFEIEIDDNDPELCLITKYLHEEEGVLREPLMFSNFYSQIKQLKKEYSKYEVLASAWKYIDEKHIGRFDRPIIAVLVDQEHKRVCMVEMGPEIKG